jgi:prepilin peptidase CpaA
MIHASFLSYATLVATAAILLYAAFTDLKHLRIPNELVILLALMFFIHAALAGQWTRIPWNIGLAFSILALLLVFYARGHVGGGDVKMLSVAFLWAGIDCAFIFSVLLLIFAVLYLAAAKFQLVRVEQREGDGRQRIAFAPSIAGALIGVIMLGCLGG